MTPKRGDVKFFELKNDMRIRDRFSVQLPIRIALYARGRALDFSTNAFGVPVIHGKVKALFERLGLQDQMQLFHISVEDQHDPYFLVNLLRVIRCIDDSRCEAVFYHTEKDNEPERAGEYRSVRGMRIDPSKVEGVEIFRPWGWEVTIIVSERVKQAMEEAGVTGTRFTEV